MFTIPAANWSCFRMFRIFSQIVLLAAFRKASFRANVWGAPSFATKTVDETARPTAAAGLNGICSGEDSDIDTNRFSSLHVARPWRAINIPRAWGVELLSSQIPLQPRKRPQRQQNILCWCLLVTSARPGQSRPTGPDAGVVMFCK